MTKASFEGVLNYFHLLNYIELGVTQLLTSLQYKNSRYVYEREPLAKESSQTRWG